MEIKIAILDDEKKHLNNIKKVTQRVIGDCEVRLYEYEQSEELLGSKEEFDVLLIDMELGEVDEGLTTVKKYNESGREGIVIFVTSHEEMVRDGYKVNAFGYVYKNNLDAELSCVLLEALEYNRKSKEIEVSIVGQSKARIQVKDIVYFETYGRNVRVHLKNENYVIAGKISDIYNKLREVDFISPHKSYIVNLRFIAGFTASKILLKTTETIPLSRKYKQKSEEDFWSFKIRNGK